jgi:4-carboxymuconolactone decarboxylase
VRRTSLLVEAVADADRDECEPVDSLPENELEQYAACMNSDRMPPIPAERMSEAQRAAADEIISGRRGELSGPFVPALRSPELMRRLQRLGEYLRYDHALAPRLRELVILLTAREWTQQFEWHVHAPLARDAGLASDIIDGIANGRRPSGMTRDEALVYDFVQELHRTRSVSDATYASAIEAFGEQGVIDMVAAVGYYTTLAMIMNVARTPAPGGTPPLEPFPLRGWK